MLCLGIESSCDDTSLALVRDGVLLAEVSASQAALHALFGGVVPEVASREHHRYIGVLADALLEQANVAPEEIDVVSVARGPGLLGSLLIGVAFAKAFALGTGARLLGVNHLHAHLFAAGLEHTLSLPAVGLLVSGGHTHLYRIDAADAVTLLGKTLDDAAGEAFDKAGKMLGLPYPAGKYIDIFAQKGRARRDLFPRPYLDNTNLDFSFSGLKTAMAVYLEKNPLPAFRWCIQEGVPILENSEIPQELYDVCASYNQAVAETLVTKLCRALDRVPEADTILLAGGVAANSLLRSQVAACAAERGKKFIAPSSRLCTDNGAMIAYLGFLLAEQGYYHEFDFESIPRGKFLPDDMRRKGWTNLCDQA